MFLLLPECMIDELFKNCLVDCVVFLLLPRLRLELYYVVTVSSLLAFGVKNIDYLFFNFIKNYKFRSKFMNEYYHKNLESSIFLIINTIYTNYLY